MGNEQKQLENRARLWGLTVTGLTMGIWGMVEESATSLAPGVGKQILEMVETQMGKKIDAAKPDEAIGQLAKVFVDEFGYASAVKVEGADKQVKVSFTKAISAPEFGLLAGRGVKKIFSHPFMSAGMAALGRLGARARWDVAVDPASGNETITFDLI
jgi:hypothetical protein